MMDRVFSSAAVCCCLLLLGSVTAARAATVYVNVANPVPVYPYTNGWASAATNIQDGVDAAWYGDLVLVAGKGHEKYQVIGSRVLAFDDVAVACEGLARRRTGSRVG